jgi:hypothetical protein
MTWSRPDFAIVSSFLLALLFTAAEENDFLQIFASLRTWQSTLEKHSVHSEHLFSLALAKVATFCSGDMEHPYKLVGGLVLTRST